MRIELARLEAVAFRHRPHARIGWLALAVLELAFVGLALVAL